MRWQRAITLGGFLLALAGLAAWQWDEYGHECELARTAVSRSTESVMNALVGGVQSHRRLGLFFSDNLQGMLDGLVQSEDVQAVAIASADGHAMLSAGRAELLELPYPPGVHWAEEGLWLVREFRLPTEAGGGGGGGGRGWRWRQEEESLATAFAPGSTVAAVLVVDRSRADETCRNSAWLRSSIVAAGWAVVLCVALAWRANLRLVEARGRTRTLEIEARHFRELSQAAAGLAHETRNPLGLIRGWTQRLAETDMVSPSGRQQAQAIVEECDRVAARINQFLAFARPREPQVERFDSAAVADELAMLLDPDLAARQVRFCGVPLGSMILADREMFRQALFNLLQNAVQFSPEGESIEMSIACGSRGGLRIEVADRGAGVANGIVDKLFTPYFTTRVGGSGLGLAIVRRIAAAHGWHAGYSPRPGGGSIFWLDGIHG